VIMQFCRIRQNCMITGRGAVRSLGRVLAGCQAGVGTRVKEFAMSATAMGAGETRQRRVIVGVDGSELSNAALRWAVEEGTLRGAEVHAITAWWIPGGYGDVWMIVPNVDYAAEARKVMDRAIEEAIGPDEAQLVHRHLVEGNPATALIDAATPDDIVVVGSHGHGGFVGSLIGSVSQRVAAHAPCPVVIVRRPETPAKRTAKG